MATLLARAGTMKLLTMFSVSSTKIALKSMPPIGGIKRWKGAMIGAKSCRIKSNAGLYDCGATQLAMTIIISAQNSKLAKEANTATAPQAMRWKGF